MSLKDWKFVLWETKRHCHYCGRKFKNRREATVDHKIPRDRGGKTNLENLTLACAKCNCAKDNLTEAEFVLRLNRMSGYDNRGVPKAG